MTGQIGIGGEYSASSVSKSAVRNEPFEIRIEMDQPSEVRNEISYLERKHEIKRIVTGMNDFLQATPTTNLQFKFHEDLEEYYVTLVDQITNEVVREIPPKKLLDTFSAMKEYIGLMVDRKI